MIGLGLFFGLRHAAPPAPTSPPPALAPTAAPTPPPLDLETSRRHAGNALAYHRDALRQDCYLPAASAESTPPALAYELNYTFDAEGLQIARGLIEARGPSRPAVTQCVLARLPALRIPAPRQIVTVTLPLAFP